MKKNNVSALAFTLFIATLFVAPISTLACDTLETVTVDGITYTRVHSTLDACPPQAPAPAQLPGLVLPATAGPTSGGTNAIGGDGPVPLTPQSSSTGKSQSTLDSAGKFDCGDPSSGGMLQRAFSGAMGSFRTIFSGGDFDLNGIFRDGVSGIGEAGVGALGDYANGAISDAFGDTEIGRAAAQVVGSVVGDYIQEEGGAAIGSVVGSIFGSGEGSIGGDAVASVLGGSGSSIAGIGGGSVPTANSKLEGIAKNTQDIVDETRTVTKQIDERDDILLQAECVSKPTLRTLVSRAIQENVEATVKNTAPLVVEDIADTKRQVAHSAAENFIDSVSAQDPETGAFLARVQAKAENAGTSRPDCGEGKDIFSRIAKQALNEECTASGRKAQAFSDLQAVKENAVAQAEEQIRQGEGLRPQGTCIGNEGATFEECQAPYKWRVDVPGSIAKDQLSKALDAPRERLNTADDFGSVISSAFSNLLSEVFSSVGNEIEGGIRGLSSRIGSSRSSGSSGNTGGSSNVGSGAASVTNQETGSYFDQLNGPTLTGGDQSNLLSQNIANAAAVESAYRSTVETMITNLQTVANEYKKVQACYQTLANGTPTAITKDAAQTRANTASTTVAIGFTLQINQRKVELANALSTASRLSILSRQAAQTTDAEDLRALSSAYQSMVDARETHTTADLEALVRKMNADASALQVLGRDAATQLATCQGIR
jgi:hypothetical protein